MAESKPILEEPNNYDSISVEDEDHHETSFTAVTVQDDQTKDEDHHETYVSVVTVQDGQTEDEGHHETSVSAVTVQDGQTEKQRNIQILKDNMYDLSQFKARRQSNNEVTRHFLTVVHSANCVNIVYFESHFDELKLRAERYELDKDHFDSFLNSDEYICHHVTHADHSGQFNGNRLPRDGNNIAEMNKELKYIIANIGRTWHDDKYYDGGKSKRLAHTILEEMYSTEKRNLGRKKCQCFMNLLSIVKSIGFFATLLIAFISVAFTSNVRQAHIRIFVEMILLFQKQDIYPIYDFKKCTDNYGEKVIAATRNRISIVMKEDYPDDSRFQTELIKNVSKFLDTDKVCEIASQFGEENVTKTSFYLVVIWSVFQVAFILAYENLHLNRTLKNDPRGYMKSILVEVVGGFLSMIISFIVGFIIQHYMSKPTVLYVFLTCLSAACTRVLVAACFRCSCCKCTRTCCFVRDTEKCNKECNIWCWMSFFLACGVALAYIVFIMLHYTDPEIIDIL